MKTRIPALLVALIFVTACFAQSLPPAANAPASASEGVSKPADKASAYYHYSLGHLYEEMASTYGNSDYANRAIEEYRQAIEDDPSSSYLDAALAELYAKTGRIRDAVAEAQQILQRDPDNVEARKLLGRIYLRSLGDMQSGGQSKEILKRAIEQYEALVRLRPDSVDDHLLLGRLYRLDNDPAKAESEFKTAVKLQPYSEEAVTTLAYLYNEMGNSAGAAQVLSTVPEANRSARLYSALGFTYEQQKDYKNAVAAYGKAVELDRDNLDAMRGLAQNLLNDGQTDAALKQYKTILDADPQDAQSYLRVAEIYRHDGKFDQALNALKQAQKYVQDSLEVPYNMAVVYQMQGKYDDAISILQNLVKKSENPPGESGAGERTNLAVFLERLGGVYRDSGKYSLAVDTFRRMFPLGKEEMGRGYQELVETYRENKNWSQATAAAKEGVAKLPNDRNLRLTLAAQLADTGHGEQGLAEAKSLLKGAPEDRDVYISLAQMSTRLKHYADAESYIGKAADLAAKPEEKDYVYFVWGSVLERQKKYDAAEEMFKKVIARDQRNGMALNYLGYMLADRGVRLEEALGYIKRAVAVDPQNGAYLDSLGWAYFKLGDYDLAEVNLRRASERMANDPSIQDHLGELYAKTGRLKLAASHWERAIQEWNRGLPSEVDPKDFQRVTRKLESAKMKLARKQAETKTEAAKP